MPRDMTGASSSSMTKSLCGLCLPRIWARRIPARRRLTAQVLHAETMASLGQLAAGVAHELNNPAGFIYSNIDLLKEYVERLKSCLSDYDKLALPPEAAARISAIKQEIDYDNIVAEL